MGKEENFLLFNTLKITILLIKKGDNLHQEQFRARILNHNLYKLPIDASFRSS